MKIVQIGVVAVLLAAAVAYAGVGRPGSAHGSAPPATHGVTVTGNGLGQLGAGPRELFVRREHERRDGEAGVRGERTEGS